MRKFKENLIKDCNERRNQIRIRTVEELLLEQVMSMKLMYMLKVLFLKQKL